MKQPTLHTIASISVGLALLGAVANAATPIIAVGTVPTMEPSVTHRISADGKQSSCETPKLTCWIPAPVKLFRVDEAVLEKAEKAGSARRFVVDREAQLAYLLVDGRIATSRSHSGESGRRLVKEGGMNRALR